MPGKPIGCGIAEPAPKEHNAIAPRPESRDGQGTGMGGDRKPREQRRG
jgi:hypothetical protein